MNFSNISASASASECVLINGTWEIALDILNKCNCCKRHSIDKPKKDKKWYDRGSPTRNLNKNQVFDHRDWRMYIKYCMPCDCTCRYLSREISRNFRISKIERCPVREELRLNFENIIENTSECSICLNEFGKKCVITTLNLCGHTFCKKCISKVFSNRQLIECPLCRTTCWSNTLHIGTWNQKCKVYL
jgi:hypothetical protein